MSAKSSVLPRLSSRFGTQSRNSLRKLPARHPLPRHEREEPRRPVVPSRDHNLFLPVYLQSSGRGGRIDLNNRSVAAITLYVSTCMNVCMHATQVYFPTSFFLSLPPCHFLSPSPLPSPSAPLTLHPSIYRHLSPRPSQEPDLPHRQI